MNRIDVINSIAEKINAKTYLEIGVRYGSCLLNINVSDKTGVDPEMKIGKRIHLGSCTSRPYNIWIKFLHMTSDDFFFKYKTKNYKKKYDIIFIDGLHTYNQSLKDVLNSIDVMSEKGVIIMHDCKPETESAAIPAANVEELYKIMPENWDGIWNGDVWKTIIKLRSTRKDLSIFVLDCDNGLGIISKRRADNNLNFSDEEINKMSFSELKLQYDQLLNLKKENYLNVFLLETLSL